MTEKTNSYGWGRAFFYGFLTQIMALLTAILVITLYAFYLGFKARGTPDQQLINKFADGSTPWVTAVASIVFVFFFSWLVSRKTATGSIRSGLIVGLSAALFDIISTFAFSSRFGFFTAAVVILQIVFGWLGGVLGGRRRQNTDAIN
jgi:hypothetical protein